MFVEERPCVVSSPASRFCFWVSMGRCAYLRTLPDERGREGDDRAPRRERSGRLWAPAADMSWHLRCGRDRERGASRRRESRPAPARLKSGAVIFGRADVQGRQDLNHLASLSTRVIPRVLPVTGYASVISVPSRRARQWSSGRVPIRALISTTILRRSSAMTLRPPLSGLPARGARRIEAQIQRGS